MIFVFSFQICFIGKFLIVEIFDFSISKVKFKLLRKILGVVEFERSKERSVEISEGRLERKFILIRKFHIFFLLHFYYYFYDTFIRLSFL